MSAFLTSLVACLGADKVLETGPEPDAAYATDAGGLCLPPELVVFPESTEEAARVLALASEHGVGVVPRGAGTGLAGGCLAPGGVVLSLERMDAILDIDPVDMVAVVQPGVTTQALRLAAAAKGLFYPPDPASLAESTLGGNAATNAGGPACLKYGVTRDYVLGLTVALASGRVIHPGGRTRKNVVGFDMCRLFVGSEGALGVITELTLKLIPHPEETRAMAVVFPDLDRAMRAVNAVLTSGRLPCCLEFLDGACLGLVAGDLPPGLLPASGLSPQSAMLLIEADGPAGQPERELAAMEAVCLELGAAAVLRAPDEAARQALWAARRRVSLAIHEAHDRYAAEDVCVPLSAIAPTVAAMPAVAARRGLAIYCFGHAGDGNIHLNLTADGPEDDMRGGDMEGGIREALELVLAHGGTISGEHGVGRAKRHLVGMELEPENLRLQRGLKALLDPDGVLNPGALFPDD